MKHEILSSSHADAVERRLEAVMPGRSTQDGAGVRLVRLIDSSLVRRLDPFLMLDFFGSENPEDYKAGFPTHPHRGFETITYMIAGRMRHRDNAGHEGLLEAGGLQWMTAGRGVLHSEMPEQEEGRMAGFQLWLNLPRREKMIAPWYRDFSASELPHVKSGSDVDIVVLAGCTNGVSAAVERPTTEPLILDVRLSPGASFVQEVPAGHHVFAVSYAGTAEIAGRAVAPATLALLADDAGATGVRLGGGEEGARIFLAAGRPLNEPVVQLGPFVMNTEEEIVETLEAYRSGRFPADRSP
jgi:redox-sensitive bicupin YhaK (pirin superfamily)